MDTELILSYFLPPGTLGYFIIIKNFTVIAGKEKYVGLYGFDNHYKLILEEKQV